MGDDEERLEEALDEAMRFVDGAIDVLRDTYRFPDIVAQLDKIYEDLEEELGEEDTED